MGKYRKIDVDIRDDNGELQKHLGSVEELMVFVGFEKEAVFHQFAITEDDHVIVLTECGRYRYLKESVQ